MYGKATYTKVNQLRYDSFQQKYQGTSGKVLDAFGIIFFLLVQLNSISPTCIVSLEMHVQRANYWAFISVFECTKP